MLKPNQINSIICVFEVHLCCIFFFSIEQVNNLREVQAMRRLSPHANILELQEVIL